MADDVRRELVAHYIFNLVCREGQGRAGHVLLEQARALLRVGMWGIDAGEPHREALAAGDLVLAYVGAPERTFVGQATLASAAHEWTPSEARVYPARSTSGVLLTSVDQWEPPVPMGAVLAQIDRSAGARAEFDQGVVRITRSEYDVAVAVAAGRATSTA